MGKASLFERLGLARKPRLTLAEFRERVIEEILRREPELEVERVRDGDIRIRDRGEGSVARAHRRYRENPRQLEAIANQIVDQILQQQEPARAEGLILLVRPDGFRTGQVGQDDFGPARPIAAGLVGIVAIDTPSNYQFATVAKLSEELGLDATAIWDRAMANLREALDSSVPPTFRPGFIMGLTTDIGLASSLLLLDDYWAHPNISSLGDLIVAPLERDELILAPLSEPDAVKALRNIVAQRDSSAFLTDRLLLRRNGAWEEFE